MAVSSSPRRRRSLTTQEATVTVPRVPWTELERHLRSNWKPGQHATLLGPNGAGKTHVALTLGDLCAHTVVVATKRRDPLVSELAARGYVLVPDMDQIPYAEVHTENGARRVPVHRRVLVWANPATKTAGQRLKVQKVQLQQTLNSAERQGSWCVVLDETMWLYGNLGLAAELDSMWFQARSSKVSVVACAQRPVQVPRQMIAQASILFLWHIGDKRDLESLRDMGGVVPRHIIEDTLPDLSWDEHEFLYCEPHTGFVARSIAPPR